MMINKVINKIIDSLGDPRKAAWIMLILCVALVFALGGDILAWNTTRDQETKIQSLEKRNYLIDGAAHKTCIQTKPRVEALFGGLIKYYKNDKEAAHKLVIDTERGTVVWRARYARQQNDQVLISSLQSFLPIVCSRHTDT